VVEILTNSCVNSIADEKATRIIAPELGIDNLEIETLFNRLGKNKPSSS